MPKWASVESAQSSINSLDELLRNSSHSPPKQSVISRDNGSFTCQSAGLSTSQSTNQSIDRFTEWAHRRGNGQLLRYQRAIDGNGTALQEASTNKG
jgi:hypothetical protein